LSNVLSEKLKKRFFRPCCR